MRSLVKGHAKLKICREKLSEKKPFKEESQMRVDRQTLIIDRQIDRSTDRLIDRR